MRAPREPPRERLVRVAHRVRDVDRDLDARVARQSDANEARRRLGRELRRRDEPPGSDAGFRSRGVDVGDRAVPRRSTRPRRRAPHSSSSVALGPGLPETSTPKRRSAGGGNHGVMVAPTRRPSWNEGIPSGPGGGSRRRDGDAPDAPGSGQGTERLLVVDENVVGYPAPRLSPKSLDVLPGQRPRRGLGAVGYETATVKTRAGAASMAAAYAAARHDACGRCAPPDARARPHRRGRAGLRAGRRQGPRTGAIARSRASSRDSEDRAGSTGCGATRARRRPSRSRPARGTVVPASRGRARSRPAYGTSPPRPPLPRRRPAHRSATPTCSAWRPEADLSPSDTAGRSSGAPVPLRRRRT